MKKIWFILGFIVLFISVSLGQTETKHPIPIPIAKYKKINFNMYKNKTIKEFINSQPLLENYTEYLFNTSKPGCLSGLLLIYKNDVSLRIYIEKFKYVTQFNEFQEWDFNKVILERISKIELYQGNKLINGKKKYILH